MTASFSLDLSNIFPIFISVAALIIWFAGFSIVGMITLMKDKRQARRRGRRVPEKRLMWYGALGGALIMWLTMFLVHHKTRHKKFTIGFPVMVLVQLLVVLFMWRNPQWFYFDWIYRWATEVDTMRTVIFP